MTPRGLCAAGAVVYRAWLWLARRYWTTRRLLRAYRPRARRELTLCRDGVVRPRWRVIANSRVHHRFAFPGDGAVALTSPDGVFYAFAISSRLTLPSRPEPLRISDHACAKTLDEARERIRAHKDVDPALAASLLVYPYEGPPLHIVSWPPTGRCGCGAIKAPSPEA